MKVLEPVIAGLAVGIMLIVAFAMFSTSGSISPEELSAGLTRISDFDAHSEVRDIEQALTSCAPATIQLYYGLGYMNIITAGTDAAGSCSMTVTYSIERVGSELSCSVPADVLAGWESWKNNDVPSVKEISPYCNTIGA